MVISRKTVQWYTHPYVHCSITHTAQDMETTEVSFNRWSDKDVVHTYNGLLLRHKRWNTAICDNMDEPWEYHARGSQKNLRTIWFHSYVWYKTESNKRTNRKNKQKPHGHRKQYGGYQRIVMVKGGQIYGDERIFDFGLWKHSARYRWSIGIIHLRLI